MASSIEFWKKKLCVHSIALVRAQFVQSLIFAMELLQCHENIRILDLTNVDEVETGVFL